MHAVFFWTSWLDNEPIRPVLVVWHKLRLPLQLSFLYFVYVYVYVPLFFFFFKRERASTHCIICSRLVCKTFFFFFVNDMYIDTGFVNCDLTYLPRWPTGLGSRRSAPDYLCVRTVSTSTKHFSGEFDSAELLGFFFFFLARVKWAEKLDWWILIIC